MHPRPRESRLAAKKHQILNMIFRQRHCSRFDLARKLNINATMVGLYVEEFLRQGLLQEENSKSAGRGRSPILVSLNPQYGCFLGLDFEALRVRAVLTDFAGEILARNEVPFEPAISRQAVLDAILRIAEQTAEPAGKLLAVNVAAPGQVDRDAGRIRRYDLLADFEDVAVRDHFVPHFNCPVYVEENVRALTFAEMIRGAGQNYRNFFCLVVRSGVGLGIVFDRKVYAGTNAKAGNMGQTILLQAGKPHTLTELVSAKGIIRQTVVALQKARSNELRRSLLARAEQTTLADIVAAADAGDPLIRKLLRNVGRNVGLVAANLANVFAPERIILGGDVPTCSPLVQQTIEKWFSRHTIPIVLADTGLSEAALKGYAAALGAAFLGFTKLFPEEVNSSVAKRTG